MCASWRRRCFNNVPICVVIMIAIRSTYAQGNILAVQFERRLYIVKTYDVILHENPASDVHTVGTQYLQEVAYFKKRVKSRTRSSRVAARVGLGVGSTLTPCVDANRARCLKRTQMKLNKIHFIVHD
jgi:hypothetical protein